MATTGLLQTVPSMKSNTTCPPRATLAEQKKAVHSILTHKYTLTTYTSSSQLNLSFSSHLPPHRFSKEKQNIKMEVGCGLSRLCLFASMVMVVVVSLPFAAVADGQPLVPIFCIFGDSVVDVGNNNNLYTIIRANFLPYGRDFVTHKPTGRFSNGKLATDFTAEFLGFSSYPPAYLNQQEAQGKNLLIGANFASGGSGYYDGTAALYSAVSLTQQLSYYKDYQSKVVKLVGQKKGDKMFSGGIHLLSAGGSDYIQNYYVNPAINGQYTADQFADGLLRSFSTFVQTLHSLGVRRIGVTNLPPLGCLPAAITLFGSGSNNCIDRLNKDAISFNNKLSSTAQNLTKSLPGVKLVVFDIYNPLLNMITTPTTNGFFESRRACCGTGTLETSLLCNAQAIGTCTNASAYIFWDGFHPSEAANKVLAGNLLTQGISLIG